MKRIIALCATAFLLISQNGFGQPKAVDLGLSVKWASCNLGANTPKGYGDYYAWGESKPKSDYQWSTYKWNNGSLTKYNNKNSLGTVDNKTTLDLADDAAHVNWKGHWRIPTDEEWAELRTQCTWTWTTQNGVNGYLVTGTNQNSIFLPAAGFRFATRLLDAGSLGYYWTSSLDRDHQAWGVCLYSGGVNRYCGNRYHGFSVRPVTE